MVKPNYKGAPGLTKRAAQALPRSVQRNPCRSAGMHWGKSSTLVQRDCYSAFLAKNVIENQHRPSLLEESWATAEPLLRRAGLCVEQSGSGVRLRAPTVAFKSLPSDRIARQRRFVRGHARDAVAEAARSLREPANPSQSAFRTPGL